MGLRVVYPGRSHGPVFGVGRCHHSLAVVHYSGARVPSLTSKLTSHSKKNKTLEHGSILIAPIVETRLAALFAPQTEWMRSLESGPSESLEVGQ